MSLWRIYGIMERIDEKLNQNFNNPDKIYCRIYWFIIMDVLILFSKDLLNKRFIVYILF